MKQLSSIRQQETNSARKTPKVGNLSSIKMRAYDVPFGEQTCGRGKDRRRRRRVINEEKRNWNERTGEDGPLTLIKVWIFTALSSPRLNTNNSQQLLSELANPHYHNVLHVYHFRNTELYCNARCSPRGNESSTFRNSCRETNSVTTGGMLYWINKTKLAVAFPSLYGSDCSHSNETNISTCLISKLYELHALLFWIPVSCFWSVLDS